LLAPTAGPRQVLAMAQTYSRLSESLADRYVVERELGQGGMATVFLARDQRHDRRVALKMLRPELAAVIGVERFLAEIKTTANLQHPHILPLHDSGEADGTVFYVMPYVEGESLRVRLKRETHLPIDEAIRITREIASALDYAHRHHVIHRDIKPENILLHDGQALVADFGIALAVSRSDGGTRMTETGMSLGTPQYMPPEQAMGEREITPRASHGRKDRQGRWCTTTSAPTSMTIRSLPSSTRPPYSLRVRARLSEPGWMCENTASRGCTRWKMSAACSGFVWWPTMAS
jgi:serine/threonine protein kinase